MEDIPDLSSDEDLSDTEGWQEMELSNAPFDCLFCDKIFTDVDVALDHCLEEHTFNLETLKIKHNMDFYSYIKLINFIRSKSANASEVMSAPNCLWQDDVYLKPVRNDSWLTFDFDSFKEGPENVEPVEPVFQPKFDNGVVSMSESQFSQTQMTIQSLKAQLNERDALLALANDNIRAMKSTVGNFLNNSPGDRVVDKPYATTSCIDVHDDSGYFNSYAHFSIHYEMLSDKVRTETYKNAIFQNTSSFEGKTVLDLGCGTGILSMFAASAGAKAVYALDQSDIVYHAIDIVRENNLHDKIQVIKGKLETTKLPTKVDIIVSEWMGYFLLFEGMLDSVIFARNEVLNSDGLLLPNRCDISLVGSGDTETHEKFINFWSNVYGFKMNCMKSEVTREASLNIVKNSEIITTPCKVTEIDINTCSTDAMNFKSQFSLSVLRDGSLTSLVGYFDTFFDLPAKTSFSTGPHCDPTHWKQTVFYFKDKYPVKEGDVITGTISVNRSDSDARALTVDIAIFKKVYNFILA